MYRYLWSSEIGRRFAGEERGCLLGEICRVFFATDSCGNVHDVAVTGSFVFVLDRVYNV